MDAIKLIGTSHKGKLIVDVPDEYDEMELEIMIISSKEKEKDDNRKLAEEERRRKALLSIVGAGKYPDFPMTKYDVHDQ